jgi:DNA repair exonuclease SbcCD ATPase subunit
VLTDNLPNANKERIPEDEFDNLIRTGIFMPIKMALGKIADGHSNATPLGVISHLKKVNNQIFGLAALWERERPEDVSYIRQRYQNKEPLQLSWEILYSDSSTNEDGVKDLKGTALRAVTLVGMPAYSGRTPIIAVASENTDNTQEENKLEELEQLQSKLTELETSLSTKDTELSNTKAELETKATELDTKLAELSQALEELNTLRVYKAGVEEQKEIESRFASIKTKFKEASLDKDEDYFDKNKEMLLKLPQEALDFMIQEEVAFSAKVTQPVATSSVKVPPITQKSNSYTHEDIAKALKARLQK